MSAILSTALNMIRRRSFGAVALALISVTTSALPARAGLFDFLTGAQSQPAVVTTSPLVPSIQTSASQSSVVKLSVTHLPVHRKSPTAQLGPGKNKGDVCCKAGEDPAAFLMHDPTLRPGDAVMTPEGIRIFEGPAASRHTTGDFSSLAEAKNVNSNARTELAQIDVPAGEALPLVQVAVQKPTKPKVLAQVSNKLGQFTVANR